MAKQSKFTEAEPLLIDSASSLIENDKARYDRTTEAIQRVVDLYEAWHAAEPGQGYDAKADVWRARLPARQPTGSRPAIVDDDDH